MKRFFCGILMGLCLLIRLLPVQGEEPALFTVRGDGEPLGRGSAFTAEVLPNRSDLAAFVLTIEYDPQVITQVRPLLSENAKRGYVLTESGDGQLSVVYTAKAGSALATNEPLLFVFRTDKAASVTETEVVFRFTDGASTTAQSLLTQPQVTRVPVAFLPLPSADCTLRRLVPSAGTLSPSFDPLILDYTLVVPYSCTSLSFETEADADAAVRINRKNLGAGGTTVDYTVTVTAADGKSKMVYTISATRLEKEKAEGTASKAENPESSRTHAETETDASPVPSAAPIYILSDTAEAEPGAVHLETVLLVLLAVGVGMMLMYLIQRFAPKREKKDEQEHEDP